MYLDTSVINFLFAEDAPESCEVTTRFFEDYVRCGLYDTYVSSLVIDEIMRLRDDERRGILLNVISMYNLDVIQVSDSEVQTLTLAEQYLNEGILPRSEVDDAIHVAVATVNEMDVLLSWNFKHLANINKEFRFREVNRRNGYTKPLRLCTPWEMMYEKA